MQRKSVEESMSMCVQPAFLIGTYDENGTPNFAPITWLSVTNDGDEFILVISMYGTKKTKQNVQRTGQLSANLVSVDMLPLVDYLGSVSGHDGMKEELIYGISEGIKVRVPTLDDSRWVYELEVIKIVTLGESDTFFCKIKNVQICSELDITDGIDLTLLDPVVYSGDYHSVGMHLGKIGDFRTNK